MRFPLLFTVGVHTASSTADYNSATTYAPAADQPGTQVKVYGWSTPSSTEPKRAGRDEVVVDVELLVPPDFVVAADDLIDLPDGQYEVLGDPEDYNHGPFGFQPGKIVNLQKVSG